MIRIIDLGLVTLLGIGVALGGCRPERAVPHPSPTATTATAAPSPAPDPVPVRRPAAPHRVQPRVTADARRAPVAGPSARSAVAPARTARVPPLGPAARARAAWLRARLPRHFRIQVQGPFVVASDLGRADFAYQLTYGVGRPAAAMWKSLFARRPDRPITILLLGSLASYRRWARQLLGDEDVPYFGYFKPDQRTMIMNIGSGIGTLWHELTHALLAFDFPQVPDWLNEGLGSLHEGAYTTRARMVGVTNWRLPGLKEAIHRRTLRPLRALVTRDDFYRGAVGLHYAHARFFVQYLQHRKKLVAFYRAFRDAGAQRDLGAAILERVLGQKLEDVDRDFLRWVGRLSYGRRRR